MVRTGRHSALVLGTTSVLVAAVGTGVVLTRGDAPIAKAATTLAAVRDATVVAPNGNAVPARDGQRVSNGDVVRTGRTGSAALLTRGRVVYVESSAAVAVINGAHQQLRTGRAVIDALHGSGLRLDLASDVLSVPSGSATEAERSVSVQVGALAGPTQITSATARRLTVPSLGQAVINGDALPGTTTPLHLRDDAAETAAVPTLVNDDVALNDLAQGIDSSGGAAAQVIETGWTGTTAPMPLAIPRSEHVLPMVIADATAAAGGTTQDRYNRVVDWRRAGGSWGVVVALLNAPASVVEATFNTLQRQQPTGQIGTVSIHALAAPHVQAGQPTATPPPGHSTSPPPTPPSSSPPTSGSHGGHHGGKPTPPVSSSSPVTKVIKTATGTVSKVLGLLPKPKHTHKSSGLLGGLLGN